MDIVRISIGTKAGLNYLVKQRGQLITVSDTKEIYVDISDMERLKLGYSTDELNFLLSGKMSLEIYDPTGRNTDIFATTDEISGNVTALEEDATAIWVKLNQADNRSRTNETAIVEHLPSLLPHFLMDYLTTSEGAPRPFGFEIDADGVWLIYNDGQEG